MELPEIILAGLALIVGIALAWRSGPMARLALFVSALVISAMLFLPSEQLTGIIGKDATRALKAAVADTPWDLSDWVHFVIFAWLGFLLWLGRPDLRGWTSWGLVVVLAISAEVAQGLAPGRSPRLDDVMLNLAGGMTGLLLAMGGVALTRLCRHDGKMEP